MIMLEIVIVMKILNQIIHHCYKEKIKIKVEIKLKKTHICIYIYIYINSLSYQTDNRTFEMVNAGDHWSLSMSRQMPPFELILQ